MNSKVVELGEFRITRTQRSRFEPGCKHLHYTIDTMGDVVVCDDCGKQISAMWALTELVEHYTREMARLDRARTVQQKVETTTLHLKAAQRVEEAWRSRTMVPTCPHCREAIFPGDGFGGSGTNKAIALRRRETAQAPRVAGASGKVLPMVPTISPESRP